MTTIIASMMIGLVLLSPMTILPHANAVSNVDANAASISQSLPRDAQVAQEKIKSRNILDKTSIEETTLPPNTIPEISKSAITATTTAPGLYILWGYVHPCYVVFQCDTYIQQTWASVPFLGAAYAKVGNTDVQYPWIRVFYLLQGDLPGHYGAFRTTAVYTPNNIQLYNNAASITLNEQYSHDPFRVESASINNVPAGSQVIMQMTYNSYLPW